MGVDENCVYPTLCIQHYVQTQILGTEKEDHPRNPDDLVDDETFQ